MYLYLPSVSYDVPIQALIGGDLDLVHKGLTAQVSLRDTMLHRTGLTTGMSTELDRVTFPCKNVLKIDAELED